MKDTESTKARLMELAKRSYNNSIYTYTDFLSLAELADFYDIEKEVSWAHPEVFGGAELSERKMVRFGSEEICGYEGGYPISTIVIKPVQSKFSDDLNHRDFLGALMNLGIKRETLGDIFIKNNTACLFCIESMAEYICSNLTRIRHTSVIAAESDDIGDIIAPTIKESVIQVSSERIDGVISRVYNLSRSASVELFLMNSVFINGRLCTENAKIVKDGDIISVRGHGRFRVCEVLGVSKKGKLNVRVGIYV